MPDRQTDFGRCTVALGYNGGGGQSAACWP